MTARPWLDSRRECALLDSRSARARAHTHTHETQRLLDSRSAPPSVAERTPRRNRLARAHTRTHPHTHTHETQRPSVGSLRTLPPQPARPGPPTVSPCAPFRLAALRQQAVRAVRREERCILQLHGASPILQVRVFSAPAVCVCECVCVCVCVCGGRAGWRRGCYSGLGLTACEFTL